MSERTLLLSNNPQHQVAVYRDPSNGIYDRFTKQQKRLITGVISAAGFLGLFATGSFVPCIPEVAKDLNTSGTVINIIVGGYLLMVAFGNLFWAPYAGYYGRQPVYLASLPLVCIGAVISAAAQTVTHLAIGRAILAFGCSSVLAVGAATISDIYIPEERGTAMGIFLGTILLGPPVAPSVGGFLATYASWRIMQLLLGLGGLVSFLFVLICLPETSHPGTRGIDKIRSTEENKPSKWKIALLNPFTPLTLLQGPPILFVALTSSLVLLDYFVVMIPIAYTLLRYGMDSPALIGLCFLPSGIGNIVGAVLSGKLADIAIIRGRRLRQGRWVPEDRLLAATPGALILVPVSLLVFGVTTAYVPGKIGLIIDLIALFFHGMGTDAVLAPCNTYLVDILPQRKTEALAVSSAMRHTLSAFASAIVLPLVMSIGIPPTHYIAAGLAWFSFVWTYIQYNQIRKCSTLLGGYWVCDGSLIQNRIGKEFVNVAK